MLRVWSMWKPSTMANQFGPTKLVVWEFREVTAKLLLASLYISPAAVTYR